MVSSCKDDTNIVYKHFSQNERKATEYGILDDIKGDLHVEENQATNLTLSFSLVRFNCSHQLDKQTSIFPRNFIILQRNVDRKI